MVSGCLHVKPRFQPHLLVIPPPKATGSAETQSFVSVSPRPLLLTSPDFALTLAFMNSNCQRVSGN